MARKLFVLALALCTTAVACSSSKSSSTSSGGSSTASPSTAASKPTGSPVVIYAIAPVQSTQTNQPGIQQAVSAGVAYINSQGGVAGHPLDFKFCDDQENPNVLTQCAQSAVTDKAAAVVTIYSDLPNYHTIFQQASIPVIDSFGINAPALSAPDTYLVGAGGTGQSFGLAHGAAQVGYKDVTVVASQLPATKPITNDFVVATKAANVTVGKTVTVPPTLTDLSSIVAQIGKPDAVFLLLPPPQVLAYMQAAKQAGATQPILANAGLLQQTAIDQTGGASSPAEGALVASIFPGGDSPAWSTWKTAVSQYTGAKDKIDFNNSAVQGAFAGLAVFKSVASGMSGDITAATFTAALNQASAVDTGGLTPKLNFTAPFSSKIFTRQFNREIYFLTVKNGKFVADTAVQPVDTTPDFLAQG